MLILTRKVGESLVINGNIVVTVTEVNGRARKARIGITAPKGIPIARYEICEHPPREPREMTNDQCPMTKE